MADVPFEAWRDSAESTIQFKVKKQVLLGHIRPSYAEDVRQRLWECVWQHIGKFDPKKASLATFITRIVDSHLKMYFRDRSRQKRAGDYTARSLDEAVGEERGKPGEPWSARLGLPDHGRRLGLAPRSEAERFEDHELIREGSATLPEDLRYLLPFIDDLKVAPIARATGLSRRQVKKHIGQFLGHFRRASGLDD